MFEVGDRVRYKGRNERFKGEELTVRVSIPSPNWRGGGRCLFIGNLGASVCWSNLELITPVSLENK